MNVYARRRRPGSAGRWRSARPSRRCRASTPGGARPEGENESERAREREQQQLQQHKQRRQPVRLRTDRTWCTSRAGSTFEIWQEPRLAEEAQADSAEMPVVQLLRIGGHRGAVLSLLQKVVRRRRRDKGGPWRAAAGPACPRGRAVAQVDTVIC